MIQGPQLLIVLAIILLIFGGSQLPKLARSLGEAQKEFKKGFNEGEKGDKSDKSDSATATDAAAAAKTDDDTTTA